MAQPFFYRLLLLLQLSLVFPAGKPLFHSPTPYQVIYGLSVVRTHRGFPVRPDNINAALKMPGHGVVETGFMILVGTGAGFTIRPE